jgi:hypothetical protein
MHWHRGRQFLRHDGRAPGAVADARPNLHPARVLPAATRPRAVRDDSTADGQPRRGRQRPGAVRAVDAPPGALVHCPTRLTARADRSSRYVSLKKGWIYKENPRISTDIAGANGRLSVRGRSRANAHIIWGTAGQSVLELAGWAFLDMPAVTGRATATNLRMATRESVACSFMGPRVRGFPHCPAKSTTLAWSSTVADGNASCPGLNWAAAPKAGQTTCTPDRHENSFLG